MSNYAKNMVFATFEKEELIISNCTGAGNKNALEKDPRTIQIKDWVSCRKAINGAIRKLRMQKKLST